MRTSPRTERPLKRVMLVDDHTMVRRGLRALIESEPGWQVCAEAEDGLQAVAMARSANPDIIVMDLSMPTMGGIDATIQLRKILPSVAILILSMHESEELVSQAINAGALGYLLKGDGDEKLMEALQSLSRHKAYSPFGVSRSFNGTTHTAKGHRIQLTPRERQVVKLVAEGNSNKVIAGLLEIGLKTIQTHRLAALRKIGGNSTADLTRYAARNKLVEVGSEVALPKAVKRRKRPGS